MNVIDLVKNFFKLFWQILSNNLSIDFISTLSHIVFIKLIYQMFIWVKYFAMKLVECNAYLVSTVSTDGLVL